MLELLYGVSEQTGSEAESVMNFYRQFIKGETEEDKFFEAIRDTRLAGFKEGMKAALRLFAEVR
ncbi:MAG: hypothetical protein RR365_02350 [Bacteroides sp.]